MEETERLTREELKAVREIRREIEGVLTRCGKRIAKEFDGKPVGFVCGFAFPNGRSGVHGVRLMWVGDDHVTGGIIFSMLKEMPEVSRVAVMAYNETERRDMNVASLADPTIS